MSKILTGLDGVVCQMDDGLVLGSDRTQHDARLFNPQHTEVCIWYHNDQVSQSVIDPTGIRADQDKTLAIQEMKPPMTVSE